MSDSRLHNLKYGPCKQCRGNSCIVIFWTGEGEYEFCRQEDCSYCKQTKIFTFDAGRKISYPLCTTQTTFSKPAIIALYAMQVLSQ